MSRTLISAALLALVACSSPSQTADTASQNDTAADAGSDGAAGAPLTNDIKWFRASAEYQTITRQTYKLAAARVDAIAASRYGGSDWAVILDADETILDNSQYEKERLPLGGFTPDSWDAWTKRKEARAVPGSVEFTKHVHSAGGKVVVVTNRTVDQCADTQANAQALGHYFDEMICAPDAKTTDKNPRFKAVADGTAPSTLPPLDVVMWIGDSIGDMPALDQTIRSASEDAFADFGDKFFQLPNPMYGSWQKNPDQ